MELQVTKQRLAFNSWTLQRIDQMESLSSKGFSLQLVVHAVGLAFIALVDFTNHTGVAIGQAAQIFVRKSARLVGHKAEMPDHLRVKFVASRLVKAVAHLGAAGLVAISIPALPFAPRLVVKECSLFGIKQDQAPKPKARALSPPPSIAAAPAETVKETTDSFSYGKYALGFGVAATVVGVCWLAYSYFSSQQAEIIQPIVHSSGGYSLPLIMPPPIDVSSCEFDPLKCQISTIPAPPVIQDPTALGESYVSQDQFDPNLLSNLQEAAATSAAIGVPDSPGGYSLPLIMPSPIDVSNCEFDPLKCQISTIPAPPVTQDPTALWESYVSQGQFNANLLSKWQEAPATSTSVFDLGASSLPTLTQRPSPITNSGELNPIECQVSIASPPPDTQAPAPVGESYVSQHQANAPNLLSTPADTVSYTIYDPLAVQFGPENYFPTNTSVFSNPTTSPVPNITAELLVAHTVEPSPSLSPSPTLLQLPITSPKSSDPSSSSLKWTVGSFFAIPAMLCSIPFISRFLPQGTSNVIPGHTLYPKLRPNLKHSERADAWQDEKRWKKVYRPVWAAKKENPEGVNAGVLPYFKRGQKTFFVLGTGRDGQATDFGGKPDALNECASLVAAREFGEELRFNTKEQKTPSEGEITSKIDRILKTIKPLFNYYSSANYYMYPWSLTEKDAQKLNRQFTDRSAKATYDHEKEKIIYVSAQELLTACALKAINGYAAVLVPKKGLPPLPEVFTKHADLALIKAQRLNPIGEEETCVRFAFSSAIANMLTTKEERQLLSTFLSKEDLPSEEILHTLHDLRVKALKGEMSIEPHKIIQQLSLFDKIAVPTEFILSLLQVQFGLKPEEIQQAAKSFDLVVGSISDAEGVIQDPAGSAVGEPKLKGSGLSGQIYEKFKNDLALIPDINSGTSVFNTGGDDAKRILHTHAPHLKNALNLIEAITLISDAYYQAIQCFVANKHHHGQNTLNLCAISSALYGARFANACGVKHIDPSITELALCIALARHHQDNTDLQGCHLNLFYYKPDDKWDGLIAKAREVKAKLVG